MIVVIPGVLDAEQVKQARAALATMKFVDGAVTAGEIARRVKNNLQADMTTPDYARLNSWLLPIVANNKTFERSCLPHKFTRMRFSRYRDSMQYGFHIDEPMMSEVRSDISFTLFLADPAEYEGGELVMRDDHGERGFKLKPGEMIAYPSTMLHRVAPVTRGERLVAFGWAQSLVRDPARREILHQMLEAREGTMERGGREFDLINHAHSNLLRMWAEP